jgi:solute carrier family 35 protein E1
MLLLCGSAHFMYNYSSFAFLAATSPITHSVANCMRRIFVVAVSLLYFRNPVSPLAVSGTAIALAGVWLFTYVKNSSGATRSALAAATIEEIKSI